MSNQDAARAINSILDLIDCGNYRQAVEQCDRLLSSSKSTSKLSKSASKIANNPHTVTTFKALKAYSLEKISRRKEALDICNQLHTLKPIDDLTLQLITSVYKSHGLYENIASLYENAMTLVPYNEELANHYFMAIVRSDNLKAQQLTGVKMHKQFKVNKYYFWSVMSLVLQSRLSSTNSNSNSSSSNIQLALAEKMMIKAVEEKKLTNFEELQLYLSILESQNKTLASIKLMSSELAQLCKVEFERQRLTVKYLKQDGHLSSVYDICKDMLLKNIDDWDTYTHYLDAALGQIDDDVHTSLENADEVKNAISFILSLQEIAQSSKQCFRGPFLAELELYKRLSNPIKVHTLIVAYFKRFGSAICCFEDIRPYLSTILSAEHSLRLLDDLNALITIQKDDPIKSQQQRVNFYKIKYMFSSFISMQDRRVFCESLLQEYKDNLALGANLLKTERQYVDDCLVIASLLLIETCVESKNIESYYTAIQFLERGLVSSPSNFQIKLLLIRLYGALSIYKPIISISASLDVKQVMLDTLTYTYGDDLEFISPFETSLPVLSKSLMIYSSNERETPEMIVQAYKFGTFSKIPEFIRFRDRLRNSIQRVISTLQISRIEILRKASKDNQDLESYLLHLDDSKFQHSDDYIQSRIDNRDRSIDIRWKDVSAFELISGKKAIVDRNRWIKIHALIPKIMKGWFTHVEEWKILHDSLKEVVEGNSIECDDLESLLGARYILLLDNAIHRIDAEENIKKIVTTLSVDLNIMISKVKKTDIVASPEILRSIFEVVEALTYISTARNILNKSQSELLSVCNMDFDLFAQEFISALDSLIQQTTSSHMDQISSQLLTISLSNASNFIEEVDSKKLAKAALESWNSLLVSWKNSILNLRK